jgi:hypothetical protein
MTKIDIQSPTRVDLAGGTLDLWPLYNFIGGAPTINVAIDIMTRAQIEELPGTQIELISHDLNLERKFKNIDELNKFEIEIIEELNSTNSKLGYNIALGGNGGNTITNNPRKKELSENVSKFHKNKKLTQEHKDKISKGNKNVSRNNSHLHTKTIIEKRTITRLKNKKTWTLSQESKDKISKGNKNKSKPPRTKEHLDKLAESNRTIDKSAKIRGKTWEEIYGIERANELRELRRIKALNRKNGTGIN